MTWKGRRKQATRALRFSSCFESCLVSQLASSVQMPVKSGPRLTERCPESTRRGGEGASAEGARTSSPHLLLSVNVMRDDLVAVGLLSMIG